MRTILKLIALTGAVAVVAVAGAGLYIRTQLDPANFKFLVQDRGSSLTGRKLTVEEGRMDWTGAILLDGLKIAHADGSGDQLRVEQVEAQLSLASILTGKPALSSVRLTKPYLDVTRNPDGTTDIKDVVDRLSAGEKHSGPPIILPTLSLQDGLVEVTDPAGPRTHRFEQVQMTLDPSLSGNLGFSGSLVWDERELHLAGNTNVLERSLELSHARVKSSSPAIDLDLSGARVTTAGEAFSLVAKDFSLNGVSGSVEATVSGDRQLKARIEVPGLPLELLDPEAEGKVALDLTATGTPQAPVLDGKVHLEQVDWKGFGTRMRIPSGSVTLQKLALSRDLSGVLSMNELVVDLPSTRPPMRATLTGDLVAGDGVIESRDLGLQVFGIAMKPRFRLVGRGPEARIEARTGKVEVALETLEDLVPPAHREAYVRADPRGRIRMDLEVKGTVSRPEVVGEATFASVSLVPPSTTDPVQLERGRILFSENRIELEPATLQVRGVPLSVSGVLADPFGARTLSGQVAGKNVSLDPFLSLLPPAAREHEPKLRTDIQLRVKGRAGDPRLSGFLRPLGGGMRIVRNGQAQILRFLPGGDIEFEDRTVTVKGLPLSFEERRVTVSGQVEVQADRLRVSRYKISGQGVDLEGAGTILTSTPTRIEGLTAVGNVDVGAAAGLEGLDGVADVDLKVFGPTTNLGVEGVVTLPGITRRTDTGRVRLSKIQAGVKGSVASPELDPVSAGFYGGVIRGKVRRSPSSGFPEYTLRMEGVQMQGLLTDLGQPPGIARSTVSGDVSGEGYLESMKGKGELQFQELVVDVSHNPTVRKLQQTLKQQGMLDAAGRIVQSIVNETRTSQFFGARGTEAAYYHRVLDEVARPNSLGNLAMHFAVENGILHLGRFQNDRVAGRVQINLDNRQQGGRIDYLVLGAVRINGIELGGTIDQPRNTFEPSQISLNGEQPPPGIRDLGRIPASQDLQDVLLRDMKKRGINVVVGEAAERLLGGRGGNLGDTGRKILEGVTGGGRGGGVEGALGDLLRGSSDPAQGPSSPAGEDILDTLRGGGSPSSPSSPPPDQQKPDLKKIGENLLKGLFR